MKLKGLLFIFFSLGLSLLAVAQQYNYIHYTTREGLPSSTVYSIVQDDEGFIWFATSQGVTRFNGYSFKTYTVLDGLPDNDVLAVIKGKKGKLWFIAFNNQLSYYDIATNKISVYNKYQLPAVPLNVQENNAGTVFIGTVNKGLCIVEGETITLKDTSQLPLMSNYVFPYLDNDDELWLSGKLMFVRYMGYSRIYSISDSLIGPDFIKLHQLRNRKLVFYSGRKMFGVVGDSFYPIFDTEKRSDVISIHRVSSDAENNILIATQGGGYLVPNDTSQAIQHYLPGIPISSFYEDTEGNYWFTSLTEGVFMLPASNRSVTNIDKASGLKSDKITSLFEFKDNVFFSSKSGVVSGLIDDSLIVEFVQHYRYYNLSSCMEINDSLVHCVSNIGSTFIDNGVVPQFTDHNNEVGGYDTLNKFNILITPLSTSFVVLGSIKMPTLDKQNRVWMAGINGLICMTIDTVKKQAIYERHHTNRVTAICYTHDENLWFSTLDSIGVVSNDGQIALTHLDSFGIAGYVTQLFEDAYHHIWFATSGYGMYVYNGDSLYNMTTANGLSDNFITSAKVYDGKLIVGTSSGLSVGTIIPDAPYIENLHPMSINGALQSEEVNDLLVHAGLLYVATNKGLSIAPLSSFIGDTMSPKVFITRLQINDRDTAIATSYVLPSTLNSLKFEYLGLLYKADGVLLYRYQMEGIDTGWTQTSFTNVQYPSLPPGKYTFRVDSRSPQGQWSGKPASVSITILPPFWQTWWFRVSVGLLLLGAVTGISYSVIRYYRNQSFIAQRMVELEGNALRANMNPHFVFNALNAIHDFIANSDERSAHLYLGKFAQLIRRILDQSRRNFISLEEELDTLKLYLELENMRFEHKFRFEINIEPTIQPYDLELPPMLIQPYLENSVRHGMMNLNQSGVITVDFRRVDNQLKCTITDNGVGRVKAKEVSSTRLKSHRSAGMEITQKRVELLNDPNGEGLKKGVEIIDLYNESGAAIGTSVVILLPLKEL